MRIIEDVCPHFPAGVPSGHICDAKYVLVGEAGGKWEDRARRPFVGPSGELLNTIWKSSGLTRRDIYITNVVPYRPPNNDISSVKPSELAYFVQELNARLRTRLSSPRVIVPTGNTAFSAITGITPRYHGEPLITKWRGSILSVPWKDGKEVKVVGTIHPASVLRTPTLLKTSIYDWQRIKEEGRKDTPIPVRERDTKPSAATKRNFLQFIKENPHVPISIDIETSRTSIICIGFAISADYGLSVLFAPEELKFIREVCESANPKIGQNFLFDNFWLAREGVYVRNVKWDVGNMFHALDPNAGPATTSKDPNDPNAGKSRIKPYSLAYLASIFTRQPYYKDEAKDDGGWIKVDGDRSKLERLMAYNCLDVMVTWELQQTLEVRLREAGKLDLYLNHYAALYTPILECMLHGVRFNVGDAEKTYAQLSSKCQALQGEVAEKAGIPLHSTKVYKRKPKDFPYELDEESGTWKPLPMGVLSDFMAPEPASRIFGSPYVRHVGKSISNAKLQDFLYRILKLPKRTKKGKTTTDAAALRGLRLAHPEHGEILDKVLDFRRMEKVASFLKEGKCDADGRVRCQYSMTVQTGRLSSKENPQGTGMNLQNVDREVRGLFVPDKGCLWLECDLSQAESRVVKVLTGDPRAIEIARKHPSEFDEHTDNARAIFSRIRSKALDLGEVDGKMRYLGKRAVHAGNYGMQALKLQEILLKDGYALSLKECEELLEAVWDAQPWIPAWQAETRMKIIREKELCNSWGRRIDFKYDRMDDETFRRGYAFVPQSEVGDLLNQYGFISMAKYLRVHNMRSRIGLQVHDALILSVVKEEAYEIAKELDASLSRERLYTGPNGQTTKLSIPTEISLSPSWSKQGRVSWKRLPTRAEFDARYTEILSEANR